MKLILVFFIFQLALYFKCQNLQPSPMHEDNKLAWFEPANSPYQVGQYEKLEIGIALPEEIQYLIDNFMRCFYIKNIVAIFSFYIRYAIICILFYSIR